MKKEKVYPVLSSVWKVYYMLEKMPTAVTGDFEEEMTYVLLSKLVQIIRWATKSHQVVL